MSLEREECRSCGAEVVWTQTTKGKAMPVDAEPVSTGNVQLIPQADPRESPLAVVVGRRVEGPKYVSHFVTCPQAAQHRKKP